MATTYATDPTQARHVAMPRTRLADPTVYTYPKTKRIDSKYTLIPILNELGLIVESESIGRRVRVKNTTGSTINAGALVYVGDLKLTAQTSATAVNNPTAGANVVINVAATFEVGQILKIVSGGITEYAIATAVSAGASVTVDQLLNNHTTPTVTALPAYEVSLATATGAVPAEWVVSAAITNNSYGWVYDCLEVTNIDTSALTAEKLLYLNTTAGGYTQTAPSAADTIVQAVGIVKTVNATTGSILFFPGVKRLLAIGTSMVQNAAITAAKLATGAIDLTSTTVTGILPVAKGGTNSGTTLNNNRLMYSSGGAIVELGALSTGQLVVGSTGNPPQVVTMGTDATISAAGAVTIANNAITTAKILDANVTTNKIADGNVTTVKIADANVTTNKIADANVTLPKLESRARPNVNYLINGGFDFFQRYNPIVASNPSSAQNVYTADRWLFLGEAAATTDTQLNRTTGSFAKNGMALTQKNASSKKMAIAQWVESTNAIALRNRTVRFQLRVKSNTGNPTVRVAILEFTGTADTPGAVRDVVNAWANSADANPGTTFFKSAASNINTLAYTAASAAGTGYTDFSISATVGPSAINLIVIAWTSNGVATNDVLYFTDAGLYDGADARDWLPRPIGEELLLCQRYYEKDFPIDTAPADSADGQIYTAVAYGTGNIATHKIPFKATKRTSTPTVTLYRPSGGAVANTFQYFIGAYADATSCSVNQKNEHGLGVDIVKAATFTTGNAYLCKGNWIADAEI